MEDLDALAAIEAACFPAAEAATREELAARLSTYGNHFFMGILSLDCTQTSGCTVLLTGAHK